MPLIKLELLEKTGPEKKIIRTINLRIPTGRDLQGLDFLGPSMQLSMQTLIARLSGISLDEVSSWPASEIFKLSEKVNKLLTGD